MNEPSIVETLTRLEVQATKEIDTPEAWSTLAKRYPGEWAKPIRTAADLGQLNLEIDQARRDNTRQAFDKLREKYSTSKPFISVIHLAECDWTLGGILTQIEMRQPIRQPIADHLVRGLMGTHGCSERVRMKQNSPR